MAATFTDECTEIHMGGDILFTGMDERSFVQLVLKVTSKRTTVSGRCIEFTRLITIVNSEDEAFAQERGCSFYPAKCIQIDFGSPAISKVLPGYLIGIQIGGYLC